MNIIDIEGLNFSYENKHILKSINLGIKRGKFIAIVGPNGSGKTTLLKNILGYLKSSSGKILVENKLNTDYSRKEMAKIISFVPQKSQLSTNITTFDFVLMGRFPHLLNAWVGYSKNDINITKNYINRLNIGKFNDRFVLNLSGGEFQKVLLARALVQEPKVMLLDEPTSALDLNHAITLLTEIKNHISTGLTAVAVLHDLNLASMFCDEIIMLKEGEIYKIGTPQEIFTQQNLKYVYGLDCEIITKNNKPYIIPTLQNIN